MSSLSTVQTKVKESAKSALDALMKENKDGLAAVFKEKGPIGLEFDPITETGLGREKVIRENKTLAITDYAKYMKQKSDAYDELEAEVSNAYYAAYNSAINNKHPASVCKAKALAAATFAKNQGMKIISEAYGDQQTDQMSDLKAKAVHNAVGAGQEVKYKNG
jgi:hypothetical protein